MADLYRKSALERMANPDQLDKVLKVTSPMSWLALGAITVLIVITVVWSFVGTIPETITSKGIISSVVGSNSVYTEDSETVSGYYWSNTKGASVPVQNGSLVTCAWGKIGVSYGFVIKKAYTKHANDATKQVVARTVVAFVEQVWVSLHGKEKLNKALEAAETLLKKKGIPFDADEMMVLIEAAVWEFNKAFEGTQKQLET